MSRNRKYQINRKLKKIELPDYSFDYNIFDRFPDIMNIDSLLFQIIPQCLQAPTM